MKENARNISEKLEKEKTENIWSNSVNARTRSLRTCNLLKVIEHLHYYDDSYDHDDDLYQYCVIFINIMMILIEHLHYQKTLIFLVYV